MVTTPKTVTGELTRVERIGCSVNGNPSFYITLGAETYRTQSDASVGYKVTNYKVGSLVTLTLSRGGRVIGMMYS